MKTAELEGAALDYYVAKAEGLDRTESLEIQIAQRSNEPILVVGGDMAYSPSEKWIHGGPIIERERIVVSPDHENVWEADHCEAKHWHYGPTFLIAAMRAFVASKFGEEVPDIKETA